MTEQQKPYPFSAEEWETCIRVLKSLKDNPLHNPDNLLLSGLISKIYKTARKSIRQESYSEKRQQDLSVHQNSVISQQALAGTSLYENLAKTDHVFTPFHIPKSCYICQAKYTEGHFFYDRLCPPCAVENYEKRFDTADLSGRYVLLTGGRVKVGYAAALKFLRSGATLCLTTRFPALAYAQLQQEADFGNWQQRLVVYGLDLRNLAAIEEFIAFYQQRFPALDILVNNAAQTIQYTDDYYRPVVQREQQLLQQLAVPPSRLVANSTPVSAALATLEYQQLASVPVALSRFGQPVDVREKNSWNSGLTDISLYELLEVNLINHIAPYQLIKHLKPLMLRSSFPDKFIVNVTSSEGIFQHGNKTAYHPHTNMTKAALNMLTLTSAPEFAEAHIYMTAVDVGWVSTGATESLRKKQFESGYVPPLDSVDAAARIFHPILQGLQANYLSGVLLKDYHVHAW